MNVFKLYATYESHMSDGRGFQTNEEERTYTALHSTPFLSAQWSDFECIASTAGVVGKAGTTLFACAKFIYAVDAWLDRIPIPRAKGTFIDSDNDKIFRTPENRL